MGKTLIVNHAAPAKADLAEHLLDRTYRVAPPGIQDTHVYIWMASAGRIAEGEKVATRKVFVIDILTFREGRIAEHRVILDQASLQRELMP